MTHNPEQLFELFFKNIRPDMNPPFIYKHNSKGVYHFWHERFRNAFYGIEEPYSLRSWAEAPQMWLAGYRDKENYDK
ncbi:MULTISPECIES: hypothetical protein [Acinetobacter]|uniref:hypothetical protein n=1 Tax=Acinetobacter TaxID=469 RepID=UPI000E5B6DFE|nr:MULTISPECIES: hypothetical protein [Acinetobacter]MEC6125281.1 hypothetical protein [Acinetobacter ursingii]